MSKITHRAGSKQKAFTLLELLVVMAILALLVGLGLRTFGSVSQKSRDNKRKQDLQSITKALELYYNDFKRYPNSTDGRIMGCGNDALESCAWGDVWRNDTNDTLYMSKTPKDPGGGQYFYLTDSEGSNYSLFTYLENSEDASVVRNASNTPAYYSETYCRIIDTVLSVNTCNYLIMSSNAVDAPAVVDSY
jgi:general secretion pathway protein G